MFYLSVLDILQHSKFEGLTSQQLLDKKHDKTVLELAYELGMANDEGYTYDYCQHRPRLSKEPVFDYVLRGEVRKDKDFRKSYFYTPEMQILSTVRQDVSLTKELSAMSGMSIDYGKMLDEDKWEAEDSFEPDADIMSLLIKHKNLECRVIRGYEYNEWGKWKTYKEWMSE